MIDESALSSNRGDLIQFVLHLGGGSVTCTGLVLNTAVLNGRVGRQVWIVELEGGRPEQEAYWVNRKHIVGESEIRCRVSSVFIGQDTILRDNPICFPVQNLNKLTETPAAIVAVPLKAAAKITENVEGASEPEADKSEPTR